MQCTVYRVTAYRVTAYRVTAYRVTAYRVTAYRVTAYRVTAYRVTAYRVAAYRVAAYRVTAYRVAVYVFDVFGVPCYGVPCYVYRVTAYRVTCTVLRCTVLRRTVLRRTVLRRTVLRCTVLRCTVLRRTVLRCTVLRCTVLRRTVLRRTVLRVPCYGVPCCGVPCYGVPCYGVPCYVYRVTAYRVAVYRVTAYRVTAYRVTCTTRPPKEGEVPGVDYNFITIDRFLELEKGGSLLESGTYEDNHYGTPKPPAEPSSVLNVTDQLLPGSTPSSQGKRRRNNPIPLLPPKPEDDEELGPLPDNWEMAYTEKGEVYFIEKPGGWRLRGTFEELSQSAHVLMGVSVSEVLGLFLELPYGWEKIDDPIYGSYYVDHINRRTQFENPVLEAKRRVQQQQQMQSQGLSSLPLPSIYRATARPLAKPRRPVPVPGDHATPDRRHRRIRHAPGSPQLRLLGPQLAARTHPPRATGGDEPLKGSFLSTGLQKSSMGFGFTIIGGDEPDEFLQVKSVIPDGPAAADSKMATGDVIVYINDVCVLGTTHADVVKLFQSVPIGQSVTLVLCRGYPLPYDPEDPAHGNGNDSGGTATAGGGGTIISPLGIMDQRPLMVNGRTGYDNYLDYLSRTAPRFLVDNGGQADPLGVGVGVGAGGVPLLHPHPHLLASAAAGVVHPGDTNLDGSLPPTAGATPPDSVSVASSGATQPGELLTLTMVKGAEGFGFTIADGALGQRVKQVLEPQGCPGLCEGDLVTEINQRAVQGFGHAQVVELLKECAVGVETVLVVQRGGAGKVAGLGHPNRVMGQSAST
ncbi:hypothetical protein NHX12_020732 [Muraenolepis orangiensis]|uniref:Membrane-associated guanylate kinase, WW and PDZ domain-containing protein 2 n=1 Tax=Muraenolepis orangiensis TaxID=630683 RepID=A0A9Q0ERY2_9TELE|nr:hypothetical protein NHX12_020732 [Muraenolepis orangiensis]